ncbi:hypothetical protein E2C01_055839 [Portunus trituberculatus]|uniref:Uncharacterized protein n=1 Tax=Portunus trituberculatus TaxID=210409 RepID=A0A5B7GVU2_PORTR|nr:hypothetical protein [Portunus trituberculatus]
MSQHSGILPVSLPGRPIPPARWKEVYRHRHLQGEERRLSPHLSRRRRRQCNLFLPPGVSTDAIGTGCPMGSSHTHTHDGVSVGCQMGAEDEHGIIGTDNAASGKPPQERIYHLGFYL